MTHDFFALLYSFPLSHIIKAGPRHPKFIFGANANIAYPQPTITKYIVDVGKKETAAGIS